MKILRKRVGSFFIDGNEDDYIVNEDSIIKKDNNEILFHYLPIKNLFFFNLNFKKSTIEKKCWVYLDLNLNKLYEYLLEGKILTNRQTLFEMITCSYVKNKKYSFDELFENSIECKAFKLENLKDVDFNKRMNIFDKKFVKFGKIFFDLDNKLITINKCKLKKTKIPNIIILNNLYEISIFDSLINIEKSEKDNENLVIINKKLEETINNLFIKNNGTNYIKFKLLVKSEDLNNQMNNYFKNIVPKYNIIDDFINQLKFESSNFFYKKKNIFILTKDLNDYSLNYISNCQYENIFILDSLEIKKTLKIILKNFNEYRIDYKQHNFIMSNYILQNSTFKLDIKDNFELVNYEIEGYPIEDWKKKSNMHILDLNKKNKLIPNFIKIGKKDEWVMDSINKLENINNLCKQKNNEYNICPISMTPLNELSIKTNCNHKFNLKSILDWINKNDCPICREQLDINKFEFNFVPNFTNFIDQIKNNKKWIIVYDKLWGSYINFSNFDSLIIKQIDLSKKTISELVKKLFHNLDFHILNLTTLNNLDIKFMLRIDNKTNIKFINIIDKD